MPNLTLPTLTCTHVLRSGQVCGHTWVPRKLPVYQCPKCNGILARQEPKEKEKP